MLNPPPNAVRNQIAEPFDTTLAVLSVVLAGFVLAGAPPPVAIALAVFAICGALAMTARHPDGASYNFARALLYISWVPLEAYALIAKGHATFIVGEIKTAVALVAFAVGVIIVVARLQRDPGERYAPILSV